MTTAIEILRASNSGFSIIAIREAVAEAVRADDLDSLAADISADYPPTAEFPAVISAEDWKAALLAL